MNEQGRQQSSNCHCDGTQHNWRLEHLRSILEVEAPPDAIGGRVMRCPASTWLDQANRTSFAPETPPERATNAAKNQRKCRRIKGCIPFPSALNGLVAGSSPAGPTNEMNSSYFRIVACGAIAAPEIAPDTSTFRS
ncbi:hypothetical protein JQ616_37520 [Bradyrhizobium tropiciagri]|uniref:hypothetical protein n=1 Tax=Bradyrhizobium tropiciagri TaxID=312253 RepID=UPI001BAC2826|nr:hypothetical protein [Bradyrhizobium tropiciagri]MBR0900686.1 hypothetical protein [Bradyrhizobium tropiciagri]